MDIACNIVTLVMSLDTFGYLPILENISICEVLRDLLVYVPLDLNQIPRP